VTRKIKWLLLASVLIASYCPNMRAQTINAASCSETDVQNALNKVVADGATVVIPAGTCTWSSVMSYTATHAMTVIGAGNQSTVGGGDATVIVDGLTYTGSDHYLLTLHMNGSFFRLSGITVRGSGGNSCTFQTYNGALSLDGTSQAVRIDHNHFDHINNLAFTTTGTWSGVLDHNLGDGCLGSGWRDSMAGNGDADWATPTNLGTGGSGWRYYETNQFNGFGNDTRSGGRMVYRFNTQTSTVGTEPLQTHATGSFGDARGGRAWEVYKNTFNAPTYKADVSFAIISGTGVIWGNTYLPSSPTATSGFKEFLRIQSIRNDNSTYSQSAPPAGWGYCGTTFNGTGSNWDQNNPGSTGYRCLDNPGVGAGDLITGNFPNKVNSTTGTVAWPHQASEPIYEWMDTWSPPPGGGAAYISNTGGARIVQNSDYYAWCDPASQSGCTTFDGTSGVGSGTLAARPATCTTGVAYWATDQGNWNKSGSGGQGQLYKCTSMNTWTLFYTPYTYPHPLTSGSGTPPPTPPTNLSAVIQ